MDVEKQIKKERLQQAGKAKRTFKDQILVGWRGWWNRMEVESRKDGKEKKRLDVLNKAQERMQTIETYF